MTSVVSNRTPVFSHGSHRQTLFIDYMHSQSVERMTYDSNTALALYVRRAVKIAEILYVDRATDCLA